MLSSIAFGLFFLLLVKESHSQTKKCPDPEEILPCICKEWGYPPTDFSCSNVTSNDELASVFNREFAATDFGRIQIEGNKQLKTIRAGDFGKASFLEIFVTVGILEEVEPLAFAGSYSTVTKINLFVNDLVSFPFEDLPDFTVLDSIGFDYNEITTFPTLQSESLSSVSFQGNNLGGPLPVDALQQLPNIDTVEFRNCNLSTILPGTFDGLPKLCYLDVSGNGLRSLQEGTFELNDDDSILMISHNMFDNIEPNAFSGITARLEAIDIGLQVFEEEIWRPSTETAREIDLQANPFLCGCDMAWLVLNSTLMAKIHPETTCADGTLFIDLDPAPYEEC